MLPSIVLSFFLSGVVARSALNCKTQSSPNPIVDQYPGKITGTINGTTAIVPIPYNIARSVIPAEYGILKDAYNKLIPGFPDDMFPALFKGVMDHDVQSNGIKVPDFTRIALRFPFVDRIKDGYSCFVYTPPQIISFNPIAFLGSSMYGETHLGTFDPPCDAYAGNDSSTYLKAYSASSPSIGIKPAFDTHFNAVESIDYSARLFRNISNQPAFGSGLKVCDNYIELYNSSVSQGKFAPVPVKGTVKVVPPYYPFETTCYGHMQMINLKR